MGHRTYKSIGSQNPEIFVSRLLQPKDIRFLGSTFNFGFFRFLVDFQFWLWKMKIKEKRWRNVSCCLNHEETWYTPKEFYVPYLAKTLQIKPSLSGELILIIKGVKKELHMFFFEWVWFLWREQTRCWVTNLE